MTRSTWPRGSKQAAQPGEILLGAETQALVRDSVVVEALEPLELKGRRRRSRPTASSLFARRRRRAEAPARWSGDNASWVVCRPRMAQAEADSSCQLFTVLGAAGVGKSRLAYEFLDGLDGVTVAAGNLPAVRRGDHVLARRRGAEAAARCCSRNSASPISGWTLLRPGRFTPCSATAASWRRSRRSPGRCAGCWRRSPLGAPLVVVLDDIHWGEEAFLDLVDHIADLSRDAPILLFCMARPELLDRRPNWGGGKLNATTVLLEPLAAGDAEALVAGLLDGAPADERAARQDPGGGRRESALRRGDGRARARIAERR